MGANVCPMPVGVSDEGSVGSVGGRSDSFGNTRKRSQLH